METKWYLETECLNMEYECPIAGRHNKYPWLYKNNIGPLNGEHPYKNITREELALLILRWDGVVPFRVWNGTNWQEVEPLEL